MGNITYRSMNATSSTSVVFHTQTTKKTKVFVLDLREHTLLTFSCNNFCSYS